MDVAIFWATLRGIGLPSRALQFESAGGGKGVVHRGHLEFILSA